MPRLMRFFYLTLVWLVLGEANVVQAGALDNARVFSARGIVEGIDSTAQSITIRHEAISNYMSAMTMPFHVRDLKDVTGLERGSAVAFQLHVAESESWVDGFAKLGSVELPVEPTNSPALVSNEKFALLHYHFTNELNQAVSLSDFPGQALAITFFYTRCPLPDYCPRLSKNFAEAVAKLKGMPNAPTNWHFISVSFDPEFDSPAVLRAYGQSYQYDPAHWSFLTGPKDKILDLATRSGVTIQDDHGTLNHNFRTLIIDASGGLLTVFPMTGNLSDMIVEKILKATAVTNGTAAQNRTH